MKVSLEDWLSKGQLRQHKTSRNEIQQLLAVFARDIADAQLRTLSTDRRFATAYNAALTVATAALAACGYRAAGEGHHYWTVQTLAFTLQLDAKTIEEFNRFRRKRNTIDYERTGAVSEKEVSEMLELAENIRHRLEQWLRAHYPNLARES
jgi:uncharacterized protein (UPF0332 family)